VARIAEAIGRWRSGRLSCLEAAEVLGMSERHFRRLRDRYEADGAEGLIDRRRGRVSGRRVAVDRIEWVLEQYRTRYFDFTVKHFHERLVAEHTFALGYHLVEPLSLSHGSSRGSTGMVRPWGSSGVRQQHRSRTPGEVGSDVAVVY
jgi:transposase